jgi:hypothetical protein
MEGFFTQLRRRLQLDCTWTQSDQDHSYWHTDCGHWIQFSGPNYYPAKAGMKYCDRCGRRLIQSEVNDATRISGPTRYHAFTEAPQEARDPGEGGI